MSEINLAKAYDFKATEQRIYEWWEKNGYFKPNNDPSQEGFESTKKPYVISIPPPNVTGELHLGHAMFVSMEDLMIRYQRMKGVPTLWVPGADHAGRRARAHPSGERRHREPEREEGGLKQRVLLEAVAAAKVRDELSLQRGEVEADRSAEEDVEVLERDGRGVRLGQRGQDGRSRLSRSRIADPREIRVEVERRVGHGGPSAGGRF